MNALQKAGGLAAFGEALAYILGFALMATVFNPGDTSAWSAEQKLAFTLGHKGLFQAWIILIYMFAGFLLIVLSAGLHDRLKAKAGALMAVATPTGHIWAGLVLASGMLSIVGLETVAKIALKEPEQAALIWRTISIVHSGLGGGIEAVGGFWVLLLSLASRRTASFPKALDYLGYVVGAAGLLTLIPAYSDEFAAVFGLSQILWFIGIGIALVKTAQAEQPAQALQGLA